MSARGGVCVCGGGGGIVLHKQILRAACRLRVWTWTWTWSPWRCGAPGCLVRHHPAAPRPDAVLTHK